MSFARNKYQYNHKRTLQLFPSYRPLVFIATDILGPFLRTTQRNQYVAETTDGIFKLTRAVLMVETSAAQIADIFLDHWILPFSVLSNVLINYGPQFVSTFLATIWGYLVVQHWRRPHIIHKLMDRWSATRKQFLLDWNAILQTTSRIGPSSCSYSLMSSKRKCI